MNPVTGELTLKKAFEVDLSNAEYKLVLVVTDGGFPPLSQEVDLPVTVVNKAMPVFDKPFYGVTVREDVVVSTSILGINASSPEGQSVIFTIIDGDPSFQFDIGFDTGTISVIYPLDYETIQYYRLTVKATDTQTGAKSEVDVDVVVLDVNDNPPLFQNTSYSSVLPENSMIGTTVLKVGMFVESVCCLPSLNHCLHLRVTLRANIRCKITYLQRADGVRDIFSRDFSVESLPFSESHSDSVIILWYAFV